MLTALAQNTSARQAQSDIFIWLIVLVFVAFTLLGLALLLRKWLGPKEADPGAAGTNGFSLAQLRRLHDQGQLSDEEFENAKKLLLARSLAAMNKDDLDN